MIRLKQRLLFVHKGIRRAAFPRLMNADKVRADNQTGRTKGISLSEAFHSDLSNSRRPPSDWWGSSPKNANKKRGPSIEHLLPQAPASTPAPWSVSPNSHPPTLFSPLAVPLPPPPSSPGCLTARCDPSCTSRSPQQTLGVWRRSGVQARLRLHPSLCTEEACPADL